MNDPKQLPEGTYISAEGWIVHGDEAYLPHEWKPRRPWHRLTDEERATYHRDWMRRYRGRKRQERTVLRAVGSLHDLGCSGPTRDSGCRCRKTVLWRVEKAA